MNLGGPFIDYRVEKAVLQCIAELGVDEVDVGAVARRLGRARSTVYAQYGGWSALLRYTHGRVLEGINSLFDEPSTARRKEFDDWWEALAGFLRGELGRGFLRLRSGLSAVGCLEAAEVARLPRLIAWVGRRASLVSPQAPAVAQAVWLLALSAASCPPRAIGLRELAWSMLSAETVVDADETEELDFSEPTALASPI